MRNVLRCILFCVPLCAAVAGLAQTTNSGDIRGSVTDPSGALIPDVTVNVLNVDAGVSKDYVTNRDGLCNMSSIMAAIYKLTFTEAGFEELVRGPITLQVGFTTVNRDVPLLKTETGEMTIALDWELHS